METFKGSIDECLQGLLGKILNDSGHAEEKIIFIKFVGATDELLRSWKQGEKHPKGLQLIKIIFYLTNRTRYVNQPDYWINGIDSQPETKREIIKETIRILALDLVAPKPAANTIGYNWDFDLYKVLVGKAGMSAKIFDQMSVFADQNRSLALEALERLSSQKLLDKSEGIEFDFTEEKKQVKGLFGRQEFSDQIAVDLLHALGSSSTWLEKILDYYLQATASKRQELRNQLGVDDRGMFRISNSVFRLAEKLNALCTEKSLENYKRKGK